jgi:hypothetical protein
MLVGAAAVAPRKAAGEATRRPRIVGVVLYEPPRGAPPRGRAKTQPKTNAKTTRKPPENQFRPPPPWHGAIEQNKQ